MSAMQRSSTSALLRLNFSTQLVALPTASVSGALRTPFA